MKGRTAKMLGKTKKDIEREILMEVKALITDFPGGIIEDSEPPDFLIQTPAEMLGIELREFNRRLPGEKDSKQREEQELRSKLAGRAREHYHSTHTIPLQVQFFGGSNIASAQKSGLWKKFPKTAAGIVSKNIPSEPFEDIWLEFEDLEGTGLEYFLDSMNIVRLREGYGAWTFSESAMIGVSVEEIRGEIIRKEEKITQYFGKCSKVWFILVVDSYSGLSTFVDLPPELNRTVFETKFDRIYIYSRLRKWIIALKTSS